MLEDVQRSATSCGSPGATRRKGGSFGRAHLARARRQRGFAREGLIVEPLEQRVLFATFTVTNTLDSGQGSLRQAINNANSDNGLDTIVFSIGAGTRTITPNRLITRFRTVLPPPVILKPLASAGA